MPPRARSTFRLPRRSLPSVVLATLLLTVTGIQLAGPAGPLADSGSGAAATTVTAEKPDAAVAAVPVRAGAESVVQIVSHPDDDLFFMNPDLSQSIRTGKRLTSVYLTAGEADGVNSFRGGANEGVPLPAPDKERYAEARQNGIRAAYAEMATGDRTSPWQRSAIRTDGGGWAELDTLKARPEVSLVWLQLHEAGASAANRPHSLHGLWDGQVAALESELSSDTPVTENFSYTKEQVVQTISGLLKRFQPTFVRMLDPTNGRESTPRMLPDHQDHMYGARFAQLALTEYGKSGDRPHFTVQNYLGYLNGSLPHVLGPEAVREKLDTLKTYAWTEYPDNYCDAEAGCGDRKVAGRPTGPGWVYGIRHSRNNSTSWLQSGAREGELWAFSVLDTRLAVWHREPGKQAGTGSGSGTSTGTGAGAGTSAGAAAQPAAHPASDRASRPASNGASQPAWTGPTLLGGTGLDSGITSEKLPDGRIALFGTRTSFEGPVGYRRDVVTAVQRTVGGPFGLWQSLGMPQSAQAPDSLDISAPAVTVDREGLATVYLRDGGHALSSRTQLPGGSWTPWRALGGRQLFGDPTAALDSAGRAYVFAQTLTSTVVWTQDAPSAPMRGPVPTALPATPVPPTAHPDGDGVRLYFRKPGSGAVLSARFAAGPPGGAVTAAAPAAEVTDLGGRAGFGPVSATETLLAARDGSGRLGTAALPLPPGSTGVPRWNQGNFLFGGAPASTTDPTGNTSVAAVALDGRLYWTGQGASAWQPVGRAPVTTSPVTDVR
ncbi:PIG-L family deacetylase [Streptomyces sp. ISL-96]|uniref:PIG-L family deacetylase n=1 Tax=Streptomyces sp. ISL-96 TaxID=2819191 RepID=UPI001BEB45B1|nr:PIG-L family deacetylase [Streptomyces sp. ISL-96]MBT2489425.1 PIG-L family deacetylase [Streptomyces sp. ISL-96]